MSATLTHRQIGDVTVVDVMGRIDLGEGSALLRMEITRLLNEGQNNIILNFEGVEYVDSSGFGELVVAFGNVSRSGGTLKYLKISKQLKESLRLHRNGMLFVMFDDEAKAVASFD